MAQDSGATDSVSNEKSHSQTLGLRDDLPSIRDGRGNFTKVLGIGTIVIRAAAEHGDKNVTIRGVLYAPDFVANVVSPRHLKRGDFKFLDSAVWTGAAPPTGVRIPLVEHKGLFYWGGIRSTGGRGTLNDCNTNVLLNITDKLGSPNETKQSLKKMLNDPTVSKNTTKRAAVGVRLAELCECKANCPASDELLRKHCRRGHAGIDVTVKALNQTLARKEIRKKAWRCGGRFLRGLRNPQNDQGQHGSPAEVKTDSLRRPHLHRCSWKVPHQLGAEQEPVPRLFYRCSNVLLHGLRSRKPGFDPQSDSTVLCFCGQQDRWQPTRTCSLARKRRRHESANRCCDALRFSSLLPL